MIRIIILAMLITLPVMAGGVPDPDWPCIQRRQPQLSIAQVWSGPLPDAAAVELAKSDDVQGLASMIALRRTPVPDAEAMIADFAATHDATALVALFQATFDHIQQTRNGVMSGITRYAHKQEDLDAHINDKRREYAVLMAAEPKDFDTIDKITEDIDWSTRIFQDRQQSLTYVCETPVILEQRAFALGRAITSHISK